MPREYGEYLQTIPIDKQACFKPVMSFESNVLAANGRKYIMRGTAAPGGELPFRSSMPPPAAPSKPTFEMIMPFAAVCAPIYKHLPYQYRAAPAVKPASLNPKCFSNDASCFITPFNG